MVTSLPRPLTWPKSATSILRRTCFGRNGLPDDGTRHQGGAVRQRYHVTVMSSQISKSMGHPSLARRSSEPVPRAHGGRTWLEPGPEPGRNPAPGHVPSPSDAGAGDTATANCVQQIITMATLGTTPPCSVCVGENAPREPPMHGHHRLLADEYPALVNCAKPVQQYG